MPSKRPPPSERTRIAARIDPALAKRLYVRAAQTGETVESIIEAALRAWLGRK